MNILGINSFFGHPSVAITENEKLSFAIEEERLTKIKGGKSYSPYVFQLPFKSIFKGLETLDLTVDDIDMIGYSFNKWSYLFHGLVGNLTRSRFSSTREKLSAFNNLLGLKNNLKATYDWFAYMEERLPVNKLNKIKFKALDHHLCHAASSFFCSDFSESLILTADGSGEGFATTISVGNRNKINFVKKFPIPHSLGFLYSFFTRHLGFDPFMDEYKIMGLASYGKPSFIEKLKEIIYFDNNGDYKINKKLLSAIYKLFGPPRKYSDPITDRHKDIAHSLQKVLEEALANLVLHYIKVTKQTKLCLAGGVALNCVANARLAEIVGNENIFVQPAANDAGTAVGACALLNAKYGNWQNPQIKYKNMYLGTGYKQEYILGLLKRYNLPFEKFGSRDLERIIAKYLYEGKVIGIYRDKMEFGPRALGNRSIIATPQNTDIQEKLNIIKGREMFRPIAPLVLEEDFDIYFTGVKNEYMLFTNKVKDNMKRLIPGVVHIDDTSRVQVVSKNKNIFIYNILCEFKKLSGVSVLVNTSLNFKGQPIIEHPSDAIASLYSSGLEILVLGNFILKK
jgi:carbamoyltransferase